MKKLILIVTLVVISFAFLQADVYIKQQTKMGAFMGKPGKDVISEHWLGTNKLAIISPDNTMIMDLGAKKMHLVYHKTKSYVEAALPLDMSTLMPEQAAQMVKSMMDGMKMSVEANGQTKKILNWEAQGYDVKITMMGMEMKMVFWATKDVPFDWKKYSNMYSEVYKAQMRMGETFVKEFKKVQGYSVATQMEIMGMKITTTTLEVDAKKEPGPGVYSVPAGYTKKDKLSMADMQQQ